MVNFWASGRCRSHWFFDIAARQSRNRDSGKQTFGKKVAALGLDDMSSSPKARSCPRTPKRCHRSPGWLFTLTRFDWLGLGATRRDSRHPTPRPCQPAPRGKKTSLVDTYLYLPLAAFIYLGRPTPRSLIFSNFSFQTSALHVNARLNLFLSGFQPLFQRSRITNPIRHHQSYTPAMDIGCPR